MAFERWAFGPMFVLVGHAAISGPAMAQDAQPRFEVASINVHVEPGTGRTGFEETPALIRFENLHLRALIRIAYGVSDELLVAPDGLDRQRFDIAAKPPPGYQSVQLRPLLRALLAERFNLVARRETRQVDGFLLRVQPGRIPPVQSSLPRGFLTSRPGLIEGKNRSMAELVGALAGVVRRPVIDRTGLTGSYDLKVEWTPELAAGAAAGAGAAEISIFTALREQMGLQLEPARVPAEIVVVESVQQVPTAN